MNIINSVTGLNMNLNLGGNMGGNFNNPQNINIKEIIILMGMMKTLKMMQMKTTMKMKKKMKRMKIMMKIMLKNYIIKKEIDLFQNQMNSNISMLKSIAP